MRISIKTKIQRAKRTALGRTLCRLAGDQTGAVMMEYVILGVLVAAAVTMGVIFFGDQIGRAFGVMRQAVVGNATTAGSQAGQNQTTAGQQETQAGASRQQIAPNQ